MPGKNDCYFFKNHAIWGYWEKILKKIIKFCIEFFTFSGRTNFKKQPL